MVDRGSLTNQTAQGGHRPSHVHESLLAHVPVDRARLLPPDFEPNEWTVICGRGKAFYNHVGNRRFRILCEAHQERYERASTKTEKSLIVTEILHAVQEGQGAFVKQDPFTTEWFQVSDVVAREKVGQQFCDIRLKKQQQLTGTTNPRKRPSSVSSCSTTKNLLDETSGGDIRPQRATSQAVASPLHYQEPENVQDSKPSAVWSDASTTTTSLTVTTGPGEPSISQEDSAVDAVVMEVDWKNMPMPGFFTPSCIQQPPFPTASGGGRRPMRRHYSLPAIHSSVSPLLPRESNPLPRPNPAALHRHSTSRLEPLMVDVASLEATNALDNPRQNPSDPNTTVRLEDTAVLSTRQTLSNVEAQPPPLPSHNGHADDDDNVEVPEPRRNSA